MILPFGWLRSKGRGSEVEFKVQSTWGEIWLGALPTGGSWVQLTHHQNSTLNHLLGVWATLLGGGGLSSQMIRHGWWARPRLRSAGTRWGEWPWYVLKPLLHLFPLFVKGIALINSLNVLNKNTSLHIPFWPTLVLKIIPSWLPNPLLISQICDEILSAFPTFSSFPLSQLPLCSALNTT
jgi:hypothetical protein